MTEKEIGEIRRRVRRERSNMPAIYGCFVNEQGDIITEYRQSTALMSENEADRYFGLMKRTLSGTVGKNLLDITFRTSQVAESAEHKLLMDLRKDMKDESSYTNLADEGFARMYTDWLYGVNLTRYATLKSGVLLRVGRVIVPIVSAIYERDMAIRNFVPEKYFGIMSDELTDGEKVELVSKKNLPITLKTRL